MKKTVMLCGPMRGLTEEQIQKQFDEMREYIDENVIKHFDAIVPEGDHLEINFTNNMVKYHVPHLADREDDSYRMFCLGSGISIIMANSDMVMFTPGWQTSTGCLVEIMTAIMYNKAVYAFERDDEGKLKEIPTSRLMTIIHKGLDLFVQ